MSVGTDALPFKEQLSASYSNIKTPEYTDGPDRSTGLDERYELRSFARDERKNVCLIINIVAFDKHANREGATADTNKICNLFDDLGFTCEPVRGTSPDGSPNKLTYRTIRESMNGLKERIGAPDNEIDIFACWIMSHGKRGHIVDSDGEEIKLDDIIKEFTEEKCPQLKGKPKLFFIQACQSPSDKDDGEKCWDYDITPYPDFFVGFSTPAGFVSYRDTEEGSFYARAMDDVFRKCLEKSSSVDFTRVMTLVANNVALRYRAKSSSGQEVTQMPCYVSTLTKRIFLSKARDRVPA